MFAESEGDFCFLLGALLWKIEQKSNRAFACGKVTIKGKRHWYEALPQAVFVALSDDTAWIIRTNGDLYLQTGSQRPCTLSLSLGESAAGHRMQRPKTELSKNMSRSTAFCGRAVPLTQTGLDRNA